MDMASEARSETPLFLVMSLNGPSFGTMGLAAAGPAELVLGLPCAEPGTGSAWLAIA